jgi:hypothetical protein
LFLYDHFGCKIKKILNRLLKNPEKV